MFLAFYICFMWWINLYLQLDGKNAVICITECFWVVLMMKFMIDRFIRNISKLINNWIWSYELKLTHYQFWLILVIINYYFVCLKSESRLFYIIKCVMLSLYCVIGVICWFLFEFSLLVSNLSVLLCNIMLFQMPADFVIRWVYYLPNTLLFCHLFLI